MEPILSDNEKIVLRFDADDEVMSGLARFIKERNIGAASISGIGSIKEVELGFYNLSTKEYQKTIFSEPMEVISLMGNVGLLDTEPVIHIHGSFGLPNYQVIGGHVHRLVVNTIVELIVDTIGGELRRGYDESMGLNIFIT